MSQMAKGNREDHKAEVVIWSAEGWRKGRNPQLEDDCIGQRPVGEVSFSRPGPVLGCSALDEMMIYEAKSIFIISERLQANNVRIKTGFEEK